MAIANKGAWDSQRSYHIVDIENIGHGPHGLTATETVSTWQRYHSVTALRPEDAVLVACSTPLAARVGFTLPAARQFIVGGRGRDAADQALLAAVDVQWVARRFGQVFLASGDGVFTDIARDLIERGVRVVNVCRDPRSQSRRLRMVASASLYLHDINHPALAA